MDVKTDETLVRRSEITIETMTVTRIRRVSGNSANGGWTPEMAVITDGTPDAIVPEPLEDERS
jgi:hypothetical protein